MVKLYVSKGNLEILVPERLTTNAINAYEVEFSFAEDWDGFLRTAIFYQTHRGKRYSIALTGNKAYIPTDILQVDLPVYVGMVGEKDGVKKTTKFAKLEIDEGADDKNTVSFVQTVDEKITFIRLNHDVFEYSADGNTWARLTGGGGMTEYIDKDHFPTVGETGLIYVDTANNVSYRWDTAANDYEIIGFAPDYIKIIDGNKWEE